MKIPRRLCALALAGILTCLPAAAYSVSSGAMQAAPATVYTDLNTISGVFSAQPSTSGTSVTAQNGTISLNITGTASATQRICAILTLQGTTSDQATAFGKLCGSILKTTAPSANLTTADTALLLEDVKTCGVRTYTASSILFSYEVLPASVRFSAVALPSVEDGIKIDLNDSFLTLDIMPQIVSSRTMVPLRGIFEKMNATVAWDNPTRTVTVTAQSGTKIRVTVGSKSATVNGKSVTLDTAPIIVGGRTLVPVRFLAESLGAQVGWNNPTQTVVISAR